MLKHSNMRFQLDFNTFYVFHAKFVNFKAL